MFFESMIRHALVDSLYQYICTLDTEHGFMGGHLCLTNLLIFLNWVTKYLDQWYLDDAMYLDFQKDLNSAS